RSASQCSRNISTGKYNRALGYYDAYRLWLDGRRHAGTISRRSVQSVSITSYAFTTSYKEPLCPLLFPLSKHGAYYKPAMRELSVVRLIIRIRMLGGVVPSMIPNTPTQYCFGEQM